MKIMGNYQFACQHVFFFLFKYQHMSLHLIFEVPNFEECEREDESANGEGNLNSWKIRDNPLNPVVIINDSVQ